MGLRERDGDAVLVGADGDAAAGNTVFFQNISAVGYALEGAGQNAARCGAAHDLTALEPGGSNVAAAAPEEAANRAVYETKEGLHGWTR